MDGVSKAIDAPYGFEWATTDHANGMHVVTARALDAGGRTVEQAVKVQVSN